MSWSVSVQAGGQRLQVLTDVSGITSAAHTTDGDADSKGCLFSILGPSGAGKTTLLDILAGRRRGLGVSGQLLLNGHPVDGQTTRDTVGCAMCNQILMLLHCHACDPDLHYSRCQVS